jgi:tryptophan synthase beta subunit
MVCEGVTVTVFISRIGSEIQIQARGEAGAVIGDLTALVGPGQTAWGKTYEFWQKLPSGQNEVELTERKAGQSG